MRIVVGIDPPASSREGADACGIVAAGRAEDGCIYVLEDATRKAWPPTPGRCGRSRCTGGSRPMRWSPKSTRAATWWAPCCATSMPSVPLKTVHATRGKYLRAEPVAALYAQGQVKHVAPPKQELEDQMCDFGLGGLSSGGSPDRLDALVWAVTELTARGWDGPRIRAL